MRIELIARQFDLPDEARREISARIEDVAAIGMGIHDATVLIEARGNLFRAEVTLLAKRASFHAEAHQASSVSYAVDSILSKVEKQVRRHKDRIRDRRRKPKLTEPMPAARIDLPEIPLEDRREPSSELAIVAKPQLLSAKPMSVEEAAMQLDLSDEPFMAFRNARTNEVNVVFFDEERDSIGWIHP